MAKVNSIHNTEYFYLRIGYSDLNAKIYFLRDDYLILLGLTPTAFAQPNISQPKFLAIGGSLTAGLRDGAFYKEAQETSFVSILSKQLNIPDFKQADFKEGLYERVIASQDQRNDLLLNGGFFNKNSQDESHKLQRVNFPIDNLAVPFQKVQSLDLSYKETENWLPSMGKKSFSFLEKYLQEEKKLTTSYSTMVRDHLKDVNFFTYELGFDDFLDYYLTGAYAQDLSFMFFDREGYYPEQDILLSLKNQNAKGVVLNIPEPLSLPYFTYYRFENHKYHDIWIEHYDKNDIRKLRQGDVLLPNDVSWHFGLGNERDNPVLDENVITVNEMASVNNYNRTLRQLAEQNGFPIVDINGLYKRVSDGKIRIGNVIVEAKYPNGNFFSADGITPTALGHALIANEIIITLNNYYKSDIPLVDLTKYL